MKRDTPAARETLPASIYEDDSAELLCRGEGWKFVKLKGRLVLATPRVVHRVTFGSRGDDNAPPDWRWRRVAESIDWRPGVFDWNSVVEQVARDALQASIVEDPSGHTVPVLHCPMLREAIQSALCLRVHGGDCRLELEARLIADESPATLGAAGSVYGLLFFDTFGRVDDEAWVVRHILEPALRRDADDEMDFLWKALAWRHGVTALGEVRLSGVSDVPEALLELYNRLLAMLELVKRVDLPLAGLIRSAITGAAYTEVADCSPGKRRRYDSLRKQIGALLLRTGGPEATRARQLQAG